MGVDLVFAVAIFYAADCAFALAVSARRGALSVAVGVLYAGGALMLAAGGGVALTAPTVRFWAAAGLLAGVASAAAAYITARRRPFGPIARVSTPAPVRPWPCDPLSLPAPRSDAPVVQLTLPALRTTVELNQN